MDEFELLKERARKLGINFSNNIGIETLRERVNNKLEGKEETPEVNALELGAEIAEAKDTVPVEAISSKMSIRQQVRKEALKLIRVRITNLDPKKKDFPGELITIANEYIGTVSKFIPFDESSDEGYHIPYCIYELLKDRQFLQIRSTKDRRTGTNKVETKYVREFAIEVLDPLTPEELKELAIAQAAAGSIE